MKIQVTKQMLDELYNSTLTIKEIATSLTEELSIKITPIRASELFNSQGYNMRKRARGSSIQFEIVDEEQTLEDIHTMTVREEMRFAEVENEQYSI